MNRLTPGRLSLACTVLVLGGCAGGLGAPGAPAATTSLEESPAERAARGRKMDAAMGASRRDELKRYVDHYLSTGKRQSEDVESKLLSAAKVALGEEPARGQKEAGSVGLLIWKLRAAGVSPRLSTNAKGFQQGFLLPDGKAMSADFQKVPASNRRAVQATMTDFGMQTTAITWASYLSSQQQIGLHLQVVGITAAVVQNRKRYDLAPSADDVAMVRKALDQARRGDENAAAGAGMTAALLAVTNGAKPTKALDDMASAVKSSIPSKATSTDEEAQAYLDGFEAGLGDARERYEAMLKTSYGSDWERSSLKGMLDEVFKSAEQATHQGSEAAKREARERRHEKQRTKLAPATSDALSTARSLLPTDGPIGAALGVIDSLKNGDAKGALKGALGFVPPGPIKIGLGLVASLF